MPGEKYNLFSPIKKSDGGTYWHKVGSAWPHRNGRGFNLSFNSLPITMENGQVVVSMFLDEGPPPDNKREEPRTGGWVPRDDLDDDVPF